MKQLGIVGPGVELPAREDKAEPWDQLALEDRVDYARKMAVYAAMIDRMDQNIGRVLTTLGEQGRLDDTLIVFLSDNGGCRSEGVPFTSHRDKSGPVGSPNSFTAYGYGWANVSNTPLRRYKADLYEGGIATPMIARYPPKIGADRIDHSVGHVIDLMPTFLELAGVNYPAVREGIAVTPMEGESLLPVLCGQAVGRTPSLFWEHHGHRAVRTGDWKLVAEPEGRWQLYDLSNDPTEQLDVAEEQPVRVRQMAARYDDWADRCGVLEPREVARFKISPEAYRRRQSTDPDKVER